MSGVSCVVCECFEIVFCVLCYFCVVCYSIWMPCVHVLALLSLVAGGLTYHPNIQHSCAVVFSWVLPELYCTMMWCSVSLVTVGRLLL